MNILKSLYKFKPAYKSFRFFSSTSNLPTIELIKILRAETSKLKNIN